MSETALRWLAERGVVRAGDGWAEVEADGKADAVAEVDEPHRLLTANEVAHGWVAEVFADDELTPADQVRLAFGLLDLLDDYWVMCEIRFEDRGPDGPLPADVLWDGCRRRLEAERDAEPVAHALWADWFEDRQTSATAFAEVLGRDIDGLLTDSSEALLRRARRVLACSGPVPWPAKAAAYDTAARLPALRQALFQGLLACYHDVYGDLDPAAALVLLARLDLPPDTPHLAALHAVLTGGHTNHHRSPHAWAAQLS
ncbi:hypothetical protein OG562_29765 [Streptomyces sp. NBC_01275]|uniref:hypothetical protein n=1 Tax=Streptomyces sp. NBC_01275 TaxID=2903807 RepID=UPI002255F1AF|nr:hypothetical protein [Streptomyces sp. NBC_01275]MCX4765088.1 hypothetical protein [Streptomyces sp. NBC_01275]